MTDAPDLDSPRSDSNCDLDGGENWSLSFPAPKGEGPGAPSAWLNEIGTGATRRALRWNGPLLFTDVNTPRPPRDGPRIHSSGSADSEVLPEKMS